MREIAITHGAIVTFIHHKHGKTDQHHDDFDLLHVFDHAHHHGKEDEHDHVIFPVGKTRIADGEWQIRIEKECAAPELHITENAEEDEQLVHRRLGEAEITFKDRAHHHSEQKHVNQLVAQRQVKNSITQCLQRKQRDQKVQACLRPPENGQQKRNDCAEVERQRYVLFQSKVHGS